MKKLLSFIIVLLVLVMPFTFVNAEAVSKGMMVTFKIDKSLPDDVDNSDGKKMQTWVAAESSELDSPNMKVWTGPSFASAMKDGSFYDAVGNELPNNQNWLNLVSNINATVGGDSYLVNGSLSSTLPSKEDLENIFEPDATGKIDISKYSTTIDWLVGTLLIQNSKGYLTSTFSADKTQVYALQIDYTQNGATSAEFVLVPSNTEDYSFSAMAQCDKSFRCGQDNRACYLCNGEYVYGDESKVDVTTCQKIADKDINSCVKNAPTGTKEYIVEGLAIVGICIIGLTIIKRKDSFRNI